MSKSNVLENRMKAEDSKYNKGRKSINANDNSLFSNSAVGFAYEVARRYFFENAGGFFDGNDDGVIDGFNAVFGTPLVFAGNLITAPLYRKR